jgi:hypothetical protein
MGKIIPSKEEIHIDTFEKIKEQSIYPILEVKYTSWDSVGLSKRTGKRVGFNVGRDYYSYPSKFKVNDNGVERWIGVSHLAIEYVRGKITYQEYVKKTRKIAIGCYSIGFIVVIVLLMFMWLLPACWYSGSCIGNMWLEVKFLFWKLFH